MSTARRRRRRLPLLGRVGAAVAVVVLVASSGDGAAAQGTPASVPDASNATVAEAAVGAAAATCANQAPSWAEGLPPIPCLTPVPGTPTRYQDYGLVLDPTDTTAGKAKIAFSLPLSVSRAFTVICSATKGATPCPSDLTLPTPDPTVTAQYLGVASDVYAEAEKGSDPPYGAFPTAHVSAYAFGFLPTTVDVTIRQRFDGGTVVPLKLRWFTSVNVVPGKEIPGYEQYGAAPAPPADGSTYFFAPPARVTGTVDVQVSNVKIDGVPLDVGDQCKASAELDLRSTGGFYQSGNPNYPATLGEPGDYQPLNKPTKGAVAGYLRQGLDIPGIKGNPADPDPAPLDITAFTGCKSGSEDVSRLFTGIVSGSDNTVVATQPNQLQYFGCLDKVTATCTTEHPPTNFPPTSS